MFFSFFSAGLPAAADGDFIGGLVVLFNVVGGGGFLLLNWVSRRFGLVDMMASLAKRVTGLY